MLAGWLACGHRTIDHSLRASVLQLSTVDLCLMSVVYRLWTPLPPANRTVCQQNYIYDTHLTPLLTHTKPLILDNKPQATAYVCNVCHLITALF